MMSSFTKETVVPARVIITAACAQGKKAHIMLTEKRGGYDIEFRTFRTDNGVLNLDTFDYNYIFFSIPVCGHNQNRPFNVISGCVV